MSERHVNHMNHLMVALLQKFFILSDHLVGQTTGDRCTHCFLSGESLVLVKVSPHPLPGQVLADSESPLRAHEATCRERLSAQPLKPPTPSH
jgi:hypothetical protein